MPYPPTDGPPPAPDFPGPDDPDAPEEDRPAIAADAVDRLCSWDAVRYEDGGVGYQVMLMPTLVEVYEDGWLLFWEYGSWSGDTFTSTTGKTWRIEKDADGYKIDGCWVLLTYGNDPATTKLHKRVI